MFVTNWISPTKIQKISEITNFFRHYFLSRTEVINLWGPLFDRIGRKEICVICVTKKAQKDCKKSHKCLTIEPYLPSN